MSGKYIKELKNILWVFLLFISFISSTNAQVLKPTYSSSIELKSQNTSIIISKGDLIKINNNKRQYFFHSYDNKNQTIRVKDIKQKFYFTRHNKIDFRLDQIDKILLRTDNYQNNAVWMWYPTVLYLAARKGIGLGQFVIPLAWLPEKQFQSAVMGLIYLATFDSFYQAWPMAKKIGKGDWLTIPLNSEQPWEIETTN